MKTILILSIFIFALDGTSQVLGGAPGIIPNWSVAKKIQVGTSYQSKKSLVWFTNAQGVLTETYFPTIDKAQIKDSQILVSDSNSFMLEERTQTKQTVEVISPSLVKLTNEDYLGRFKIEHIFYTKSDRSMVIDEVTVTSKIDGLSFYILVNPALNNTGFHDSGYIISDQLNFTEGETHLQVAASVGLEKLSLGYVGYTDGFQDLKDNYILDNNFTEITTGNIAGIGKIKIPSSKGIYKFHITYDFSESKEVISNENLSFEKDLYSNSWNKYFEKINIPSSINNSKEHQSLYLRSLYTLQVHEDKLNPGALIASLSKPWGDETYESPGVFTGGYHMVWPRDLYHVCTAYINAGDLDTPKRALNFLKRVQYKKGTWSYSERSIPKRGGFPQNIWTNGKEYWGGLQLDQTAYPVHIFYGLWLKADPTEKKKLLSEFGEMITLALDFIVNYGPWTGQERWEENFGISPSTFSAAASALFMGEKILSKPIYKEVATRWLTKPNDNIHTWTFTNRGLIDGGEYYIRVGGCSDHYANWNPNNGATCTISNSGQRVEQTQIIDQGFLKLTLLGLVPANDYRIKKSKEVIDNNIKVKTPNGYGWYRYSFDAYGENKTGRLWPLLSGEHARYEIERYKVNDQTWKETLKKVDKALDSYIKFANEGLMIPEQVWEHTGEGTGGATPLAWSHAEYIKLLWSKENKHNVENLLQN